MKNTRIKCKEDLVKKSIDYHGDIFNYDKLVFIDGTTPFIITCKVCGDFNHTSKLHFKNKSGCPKCKRKQGYLNKDYPFKLNDFLTKAKNVHGNKFGYDDVVYVNSYTPVIINCPIHGKSEIEPRHHYKGSGCYRCGRDSFSVKAKKYKTSEQLLTALENAQGDKFDYSEVKFLVGGMQGSDKIDIICKNHGLFKQAISSHVNGNGCNQCRYFGYTRESYIEYCKNFSKETSTVYILRFYTEDEEFYKIGITAQTIEERYSRKKDKGGYKYEIIYSIDLKPAIAWDAEDGLKKKYIPLSHKPKNWFPGSTECFDMTLPTEEIINNLKKFNQTLAQ